MCNDLTPIRQGIKSGNGVPTIPLSNDHQDGTWLATDIYPAEMYQDVDTGLVYTRDVINGITTASGETPKKVWKALVLQKGTSAPTIVVVENSLGVTITPSYISVGKFSFSGFDELLAGNFEVTGNFNSDVETPRFITIPTTSSVLALETLSGGVYSNGVAEKAGNSITINKY